MKTSLALLLTTMAAATTFMSCKSDKAAAPATPAAEKIKYENARETNDVD